MNITLATVRQLLRTTLGHDSFVAGFLKRSEACDAIPTACITADGQLRYNPDFVREQVKNQMDLFCLIFHEILHPAFGHFIHPKDEIANIACDAIINAAISQLFPEASGDGALFRRMYPEQDLLAVLRPDSKLQHTRYARLYQSLYPRSVKNEKLSAGEVIQSLKVLVPVMEIKVLLLGSHGLPDPSTGGGKLPAEIVQRISGELLEALKSCGKGAGYYDSLLGLLVEVLKVKKTLRQSLLENYATRKKVDDFFAVGQRPRRITSPFPLNPSRRDMVLLSAGIWPGIFRNRQTKIIRNRMGVAVFLDVSGSVNEYLPGILGILSKFKDRIRNIYLFSNQVIESSMAEVCQGQIKTTYGTDFDCIAQEIIAKSYDRAVVITDGIAEMEEAHAKALKDAGTNILTILFDNTDRCPAFEPFGEVVALEEVTEDG